MNRIRKGMLFGVGLFLPFVAQAAPVFAPLAGAAGSVRTEGAAVWLNEMAVGRFLIGGRGVSAAGRADRVARALRASEGGEVAIKASGVDRFVLLNGRPVLTVTRQDARRAGKSVGGLAVQWADRIQAAYALPPLRLSDNYARLAVGGSALVGLSGSEAARSRIETVGDAFTLRRGPGRLYVTGRKPGRGAITVTSGGIVETVDVEVRPYAANFPQTLRAQVTGAPATESTVRGSIETALRAQFRAVPGARWSFGKVVANAIGSRGSRRYRVKVWAAGPGAYFR